MQKPVQRFLSNVAKGIGLGLFVGTGFSAWVTFLRLTVGTGPFDRLDTTYPATVALYYGGGLVGGAIIGTLLPLRRWPWGAALLGMLGVFPLYFGVALTNSGSAKAFTLENVADSAFLAFVVGGAVGMWAWLDANPESTGVVEVLRHPDGTVVAKLWAFALAIAGTSYLVLPRWTGKWNPTLMLFTAFVLFLLPLGVAVLVTLVWMRESERRPRS